MALGGAENWAWRKGKIRCILFCCNNLCLRSEIVVYRGREIDDGVGMENKEQVKQALIAAHEEIVNALPFLPVKYGARNEAQKTLTLIKQALSALSR